MLDYSPLLLSVQSGEPANIVPPTSVILRLMHLARKRVQWSQNANATKPSSRFAKKTHMRIVFQYLSSVAPI